MSLVCRSEIIRDPLICDMLWLRYPLAYSFCALPISITRWIYFTGDQNEPTAALFFANFTFNLFGAVNVLLLLTTRPGLFALNSPLDSPHTIGTGAEQRYHSKLSSGQTSLRSMSLCDDSIELSSPTRTRRTLDNSQV